jgi:hypothetical protein
MEYPAIYFDEDEQSEDIGWVVRVDESFSFDGFRTKEDAIEFLNAYLKRI